MKQMLGGCCVCADDRGYYENPLVYCDGIGCTVAVHQACYGIVSVPSGNWYCRTCETHERTAKVQCDLCPIREGALKPTDSGGWAHVVCALYIPEIRFGNVSTMEPIQISLIPQDRFNKSCYLCLEKNPDKPEKASFGACMACNKPGCKQNFHVTCGQYQGLLCEEAGNLQDNVKYCGYCGYHFGKMKKTSNLKIIPPYQPVISSRVGSSASPEKLGSQIETLSNSSSSSSTNLSGNASPSPQSEPTSTTTIKSRNNISPDINLCTSRKPNKPSSLNNCSTNPSKIRNLFNSNSNSFASSSSEIGNSIIPKKRSSHDSIDDKLTAEDQQQNKILKRDSNLHDIIATSLDKPLSSLSNSKFDHSPTISIGGIETTTPTNNNSNNNNNKDKLSPPDIKPHVTLTAIPMDNNNKTSTFGQTKSQNSVNNSAELADRSPELALEKSCRVVIDKLAPNRKVAADMDLGDDFEDTNVQRNTSRGNGGGAEDYISSSVDRSQPVIKMLTQQSNRDNNWDDQDSPEPIKSFPGGAELLNKKPVKRGPGRPPARGRSNGQSREDDMTLAQLKKAGFVGGKGSRGARGGGRKSLQRVSSSNSLGNGNFNFDENSNDDPSESNSNHSSVRGRPPSSSFGAKNNIPSSTTTTAASTKNVTPREEEFTPTLSQLSQQMKQNPTTAENSPLAPHMFGNSLNPSSKMAVNLVGTLSEEMEVMAAAVPEMPSPTSKFVGIQFPGGSNKNPMAMRNNNSNETPLTLEALLEHQWVQGSQFLMEQAEHLDIAQLLSCLNQLKHDNKKLEEHVAQLISRKDQLTIINARLSIPLTNSTTVNNLISGGTNGHNTSGGSSNNSSPVVSHNQIQNQNPNSMNMTNQQHHQQQQQQQHQISHNNYNTSPPKAIVKLPQSSPSPTVHYHPSAIEHHQQNENVHISPQQQQRAVQQQQYNMANRMNSGNYNNVHQNIMHEMHGSRGGPAGSDLHISHTAAAQQHSHSPHLQHQHLQQQQQQQLLHHQQQQQAAAMQGGRQGQFPQSAAAYQQNQRVVNHNNFTNSHH